MEERRDGAKMANKKYEISYLYKPMNGGRERRMSVTAYGSSQRDALSTWKRGLLYPQQFRGVKIRRVELPCRLPVGSTRKFRVGGVLKTFRLAEERYPIGSEDGVLIRVTEAPMGGKYIWKRKKGR